MLKNSYNINTFFKNSSAIYPALFSFIFNLIIASSVSVDSYSEYILIISWGTFFGTMLTYSFVDLGISKDFKDTSALDNLALSIISSFFLGLGLIFLIILYGNNNNFFYENVFLLISFSIAFAWTRSFSLYWANSKNTNELIRSRFIRAIALLIFGLVLLNLNYYLHKLAIIFQVFAFISSLFFAFKYFKNFFNFQIITRNLNLQILKICTTRTSSMGIDMIHIPLCLYAMNSYIEMNPNSNTINIFIIGIGLPIIGIVTQILNEFFRGRIENFEVFMRPHENKLNNFKFFSISFILLFLFLMFYLQSFYLIFMFFIFGKLITSFTGLLVYKYGLEKIDLAINFFTTASIVAMFISQLSGSWLLVNLILASITAKYLIMFIFILRAFKIKNEN